MPTTKLLANQLLANQLLAIDNCSRLAAADEAVRLHEQYRLRRQMRGELWIPRGVANAGTVVCLDVSAGRPLIPGMDADIKAVHIGGGGT